MAKKAATKKKASKRSVRYTDAKKAEVVAFVVDHNKANKRGGLSAAVKKFDISPITISSWMKKSGKKTKSTRGRKPGRPKATSTTVASTSSSAGLTGKLERMLEIEKQIKSLQSEFDALRKQL